MDMAAFFNNARTSPFAGSLSQNAVDGMTAIIEAFRTYGDGDARKLAYMLGTAFHEADKFRTMEEYASGAAYEGRASLGNTQAGDGVKFKGRGFVQITGRRNYADWSRRLGLDLLKEPAMAANRAIAARILVQGLMLGTFTGKKLGDYINDAGTDYRNARRTVNGTDRAQLVADHAAAFALALTAGGYEDMAPPAPEAPVDAKREPAAILTDIEALHAELRASIGA